MNSTRHCLALDLHDDPELVERYKGWHRPGGPPAAVTRSIREADILDMEIWLVGTRLFMIMEAGPNFDPVRKAERDATDPDVIAWEKAMWEFQKPLPFAKEGEKWMPATRIYTLQDQ